MYSLSIRVQTTKKLALDKAFFDGEGGLGGCKIWILNIMRYVLIWFVV